MAERNRKIADAQSTSQTPGTDVHTILFLLPCGGIAGAPKVGNAEQWAPRIAKGTEALLAASIAGIPPGMPPRGLCDQCSDAELTAAIDYMISRSR